MRPTLVFATLLMGALGVGAQVPPAAPSPFCAQMFGEGGKIGFNETYARVGELGVHTVRMFADWASAYRCPTGAGPGAAAYAEQFERLDFYIDSFRKQGVRDIVLTIGIDAVPPCACDSSSGPSICLPDERGYVHWLSALATHLKGRVRLFQLGNELNGVLPAWTPETYARYLIVTYDTIKAQLPDALVSTSGLAFATDPATGIEPPESSEHIPPFQYAARMMAALNKAGRLESKPAFDAVGLHPYRTRRRAGDTLRYVLADGQGADMSLKTLLQAYAMVHYERDPRKRFQPVWATEFGWMAIDNRRHDELYLGTVTLDEQRRYVDEVYGLIDDPEMAAVVQLLCYSVVIDDVPSPQALTARVERTQDGNDHFLLMGLLFFDGRPKPAAAAYKARAARWRARH